MRGQDTPQAAILSYLSPEERVPATHPLRPIRQYVDAALTALSPQLAKLYARTGRPAIAPEKLLRALVLQVLSRLRSERLVMEELQSNRLVRWFIGLDLDAPVWDVTVFTKNRDRLLEGEGATAFFEQVLAQAKAHRLLSDEHFTVDGTMIEAWAGQKSFKKRTDSAPTPPADDPGHPSVDCRGEANAMDGRTIRQPGYASSQRQWKRVEAGFGGVKTVGLLRKVNLRGVRQVWWRVTFAAAVYNLVRIRNLVEAPA